MLERCTGTLTDLLKRLNQAYKQKGLPVMDVLTLGITLTDATHAAHAVAHSRRLDIQPNNVLLRSPGTDTEAASGTVPPKVAVLADVGLLHKLPPRVQETLPSETCMTLMPAVAEGTPAYLSLIHI